MTATHCHWFSQWAMPDRSFVISIVETAILRLSHALSVSSCERANWLVGVQHDPSEFFQWLFRQLDGELAPSVILQSAQMCAQCEQPVVRDAWLECITLDVKRGQKDYDLNRVSSLQELVDNWVEKESKYPMFVHENRCLHETNEHVEPSVIESLSDHLFITLPRVSDSGGPTVYAP
ncbi:hypothetical protein DL93DRAFT_2076895, partial [Clavulina sp. PMI_390]